MGQIFGREDSGRGCADVRDRVHRPVGVERRDEGTELVERNRERHAHVEWGVAVDADTPARGLQAPVRLDVPRHEPVLREADPVDPPDAAVDDDPLVRGLMRSLLGGAGLEVETYESARCFLERFDPDRPGCVVLDLKLEEMTG